MRKVAAKKMCRWAALRSRASDPSFLAGCPALPSSPSRSHSSPCRNGWLNSESASPNNPERLSNSPSSRSAPWARSSLSPRCKVTRRQVAWAASGSVECTQRTRRSFGGSSRAATCLAPRGPRSSNTFRTDLAAQERGNRSPSIRAGLPRRSIPRFIFVAPHFAEFQ